MAERDGAVFPWGGTAARLLRDYKRSRESSDRLPPFAAKMVRQVCDETSAQVRRVKQMEENPEVDLTDPKSYFQPTRALLLEATLRNRRCLRAYSAARG